MGLKHLQILGSMEPITNFRTNNPLPQIPRDTVLLMI